MHRTPNANSGCKEPLTSRNPLPPRRAPCFRNSMYHLEAELAGSRRVADLRPATRDPGRNQRPAPRDPERPGPRPESLGSRLTY